MSWYREAEGELTEAAAAVQSQRLLAIDRIRALVQGLVSSLRQDDQLVVEALSGPPGPTLITNLINVSILGTKVGIGLGYYGEELDRLALGGLVHDIGLFAVPASVIAKAGRLTPEERMKGLPWEGRLKGVPPEERLKGLSPEEIKAYLKHLEDGSSPAAGHP